MEHKEDYDDCAKKDGEKGDGEILPINAKMTPDLPPHVERKEYLPLPKWLTNDYKSNVAELEGWKCMEIARANGSGKKDKYYTHKDYAHKFRSKNEVQHFLDTGEVKGKGLLQKKLADDTGGARRSTKRTMLLAANNDPPKTPTDGDGDQEEQPGFDWDETIYGYQQRHGLRRSSRATHFTGTTHCQGRACIDSDSGDNADGGAAASGGAGTSGAHGSDDIDWDATTRDD